MGPEEGLRRGVGAGQRAGMAGGEFGAIGRAAELVGDDRLARGMRAAGKVGIVLRLPDGFEEQQDGIDLRVVDQQPGDLAGGEVGLVPRADDVGEADAARRAARHDGAHRWGRALKPDRN